VNAANSALAGGGGVDGAIHRAGGPSIMAELQTAYPEGCATGSAVITAGGNLPASWVILGGPTTIERVTFVLFSERTFQVFAHALGRVAPGASEGLSGPG
jgi:hypothetical protein